MQEALADDATRVEQTIEAARTLIDQSWSCTLRGAVAFHQGRNLEAQSLLKNAIAADPGNIAAKSMLSIAFYHEAQLEDWHRLMANFDQWKPRPQFEEAYPRFLSNYIQALIAYSQGQENEAREFLKHCITIPSMSTERHWAQALLARWSEIDEAHD